MLPFQFKIKGYLNEIGEYTAFHPAESATILQFILQHWFNESLPNNLDIIVIKNQNGDQLVIDHVKRDIFDYYLFKNDSRKDYLHKKTDIQFMFFVLESFFNHRLDDLSVNLNEKRDDWKFMKGDFLGKDFTYRISRKNIWNNLGWLGYQLFFLLLLVGFSIRIHPAILFIVGINLVFLLFSWRTMIMYRGYYLDNHDIEIRFSKGDPDLHIRKGSWTKSIPKTDIRGIVKFISPIDDARSQGEMFTEIEFLNGNVLNLTCFVISQTEVDHKFGNDLIPFEVEVNKSGRLKRPTDLSHYFSAIRPVSA